MNIYTDGPHGSSYLGALDTAFLISYAVAMFFRYEKVIFKTCETSIT